MVAKVCYAVAKVPGVVARVLLCGLLCGCYGTRGGC